MSGHSKWSKVKHQKAVTDVVKSKAFTKAIHGIIVAIREGGDTNPENNTRLRFAFDQAKKANVPKDTIERAVEKALSKGNADMDEVRYEAYAPHGVALLIDAVTDNRNRTVSEVKHALERGNGRLAESGSVLYQFTERGVITIQRSAVPSEDTVFTLAVEGGAADVIPDGDVYLILTPPDALHTVQKALMDAGVEIGDAKRSFLPNARVSLPEDAQNEVSRLISALLEISDVQDVYATL